MPYENIKTPWGLSDGGVQVAPGLVFYNTPGHGGLHVSGANLKSVPPACQRYARKWSGSASWYEEDIAITLTAVIWPDIARKLFAPRYHYMTDEEIRTELLASMHQSAEFYAKNARPGEPSLMACVTELRELFSQQVLFHALELQGED